MSNTCYDPKAMKWSDIAQFIVAHLVALCVCGVLFVVVPLVLFVLLILLFLLLALISNDPGGPLFFPGLIGFGLVYLVCSILTCLTLFGISIGLQALRRWVRFSWWVPVALVFPVIFTVLIVLHPEFFWVTFVLALPFCVYWLALSGSDRILTWARRKFRKRPEKQSARAQQITGA